jgi:hypothetical protein
MTHCRSPRAMFSSIRESILFPSFTATLMSQEYFKIKSKNEIYCYYQFFF